MLASAQDGPRATITHVARTATKRKIRPGRAQVLAEIRRRSKKPPPLKTRADLANAIIDLVGPKGYTHGWVRAGAPLEPKAKLDYAQSMLDEATDHQISNVDDDAFDLVYDEKEHGDYEDASDSWADSSTRDRLWGWGAGDPALQDHIQNLYTHIQAGDHNKAHAAAKKAHEFLTVSGYADDEDLPRDPMHPDQAEQGVKKMKRKADLAITPGGRPGDASPLGKKGPRKLTDYTREIAHALMRRGFSKSHAIATARNSQKRWASGRGKVRPQVRAGAAASLARQAALDHNHSNEPQAGAVAGLAAVQSEFARRGVTIDLVGPKGYKHGWIYVGGRGLPGHQPGRSKSRATPNASASFRNKRMVPQSGSPSHFGAMYGRAHARGDHEMAARHARATAAAHRFRGDEASAKEWDKAAAQSTRDTHFQPKGQQSGRPAVIMNQGPPKNPPTVPRNLATGKQAEHQPKVQIHDRNGYQTDGKARFEVTHPDGTKTYHATRAGVEAKTGIKPSRAARDPFSQDKSAARDRRNAGVVKAVEAEAARRKVDARPPGTASNYGPGNDLLSHTGNTKATNSNVGQVLDVGDHQWQKGSDGQWRHTYTRGWGGTEYAHSGNSGRRADVSGVHATKTEAKRLDDLWAKHYKGKR